MTTLSRKIKPTVLSFNRHVSNSKIFQHDENNNLKCSLIPGDGFGPEMTDSVQEIFDYAKFPVTFETVHFSEVNPQKSWPFEDVVKSIRKNKVCLEGTIAIPNIGPNGNLEPLLMKLVKQLDCYANVLHYKTMPGIKTRHGNLDISVIREYTEGEYAALEHQVIRGVVESLKIVTRFKSERIAKFAFDYATRKKKTYVTVVHKANILKLGDGLFKRCFNNVAKLYPHIKSDDVIVDNCTHKLITTPKKFEVVLTPNLYGNILDAIAAGLVGGPGLVAAAAYGDDCALFRSGTREYFFDSICKNKANPTGIILASVKLLNYVGLVAEAELLKNAVVKVIADGKIRTCDIGGKSTTSEFVNAIKKNIGYT